MVHSKRCFPSLLCHSSGWMPFSITLLAQEEPPIFPKKQFLEITAKPPKVFLQKGGVWILPVSLLMSTLRHTDSKKDEKPTATPPMCHHNYAMSFQGHFSATTGTAQPVLPCKRSSLGKL